MSWFDIWYYLIKIREEIDSSDDIVSIKGWIKLMSILVPIALILTILSYLI